MTGFQEKTVFDLHETRKREKEKLVIIKLLVKVPRVMYTLSPSNTYLDLKVQACLPV